MDDQEHKGWNKEDKLLFYQAIRIYGSQHIELLHEHIPHKSKEQIEKMLIFFKNKALKQENETNIKRERTIASNASNAPLHNWAKMLTETLPFHDLHTETAAALRLIADYEDIPESVRTETIDFRKLYHTLANALEGKTLYVDKKIVAVLDKCIVETALTSKGFTRRNAFRHALNGIKISDNSENDLSPFRKPTENNELSVLRHIAGLKNYNPFNISEENLNLSVLS